MWLTQPQQANTKKKKKNTMYFSLHGIKYMYYSGDSKVSVHYIQYHIKY